MKEDKRFKTEKLVRLFKAIYFMLSLYNIRFNPYFASSDFSSE